jgi:hypothetical protein
MLALADSAAGKRALCPRCEAQFQVPLQSHMFTGGDTTPQLQSGQSGQLVECPACHRTLAFDPSLAGQPIICPTCQRRIQMPFAGGLATELGRSPEGRSDPWAPVGGSTATATPRSYPGGGTAADPQRQMDPRMQPPRRDPYSLPAIFLIVFSVLALLMAAVYMVSTVLGLVVGGGVAAGELVISLIFFTFAAVSHLATLIGSFHMLRRRRLDLAKIGAIAAFYPCGFCGFLQIPFAIWALVVLHQSTAPADFATPADRHGARLH